GGQVQTGGVELADQVAEERGRVHLVEPGLVVEDQAVVHHRASDGLHVLEADRGAARQQGGGAGRLRQRRGGPGGGGGGGAGGRDRGRLGGAGVRGGDQAGDVAGDRPGQEDSLHDAKQRVQLVRLEDVLGNRRRAVAAGGDDAVEGVGVGGLHVE